VTDEPSGTERRREPRVPTRIQVDYAAASTFLFAYITDISSLGIFISTDQTCDAGTRLTLRFTPPPKVRDAVSEPDQPFEVEGIVRWTARGGPHDPGMGVEFVALSEATRSRLLELINAIAYLDED
jgi:type IV pilus assembly protein PilZ